MGHPEITVPCFPVKGGRLHRKIQRSMKGDYQAEVSLKKESEYDDDGTGREMGSLQKQEKMVSGGLPQSQASTDLGRKRRDF